MEATTASVFEELKETLTENPKRIPSKFFYNSRGDKLFQKIMSLPEYYLTKAEYEIFENNASEIVRELVRNKGHLNLIELGAGDGTKTELILAEMMKQNRSFTYFPVDISGNVLIQLEEKLSSTLGDFDIQPIESTYADCFENLNHVSNKVLFFLGANIGNFREQESIEFLSFLNSNLDVGDELFLGVDLKKDPQLILDAYNDKSGVTSAFNLNLLERINQEAGANFNVSQFKHYPTYDPVSGEARSYLVSLKHQVVNIQDINLELEFEYGEVIHTEISKKFSVKEIETIAQQSGFKKTKNWLDCKQYFTDILLTKD